MGTCTDKTCYTKEFRGDKTSKTEINHSADLNDTFEKKLEQLLNDYSMENGSNTPDFLLARFLMNCLNAYNAAVRKRDIWYKGKVQEPAQHLPKEGS